MEFADFLTAAFWAAVVKIIIIDILLGGDNAIVIALACRNLPPEQQKKGIFWGTAGAIALRVVLIVFAVTLLSIPYLKVVGGAMLLWIGIQLLSSGDDDGHEIATSATLGAAIKTIIIADLAMSVDNVIAIAGAAQMAPAGTHVPLIIFGLLVSVPLIVWGSTLVLKLIEKFPVVVVAGGALLGWIAGGMIVSDVAIVERFGEADRTVRIAIEVVGALMVVAIGKFLAARAARRSEGEAASA